MADIECVFESMTDKGSIYISNFTAAQNTQLLRSNPSIMQKRASGPLSQLHAAAFSGTARKKCPTISISQLKTTKNTISIDSSTKPSTLSSRHASTPTSSCTAWQA